MIQRQVLLLTLLALRLAAQAGAWYQADFPPEEFRSRWSKVFDRIGNEAVAVLQGVAQTNGYIMPRQTNEFYYLCGVETPHSYLLLDGRSRKVTLYLPPRNPRLESAEGKVLSAEDAVEVKRLTGVDEVSSTDAIRGAWFEKLAGGAPRTVYALFSPAEGNSQSRGELVSANASIASDYWDGRTPERLISSAYFKRIIRGREFLTLHRSWTIYVA